MRVLYIFPVRNNRVIFNSYRGLQYTCNPRYISEKLIELYPGRFEVVWAFREPEHYLFLKEKGIKLVRFNSIKRFYYEATAKVSINNVGSFSWMPIRKGQEHVNTWHSGLDLEACGMNEKANDRITKYTIALGGRETTLFLSANQFFSDYSVKVQFGYDGMLLNCGLPRSDNLTNGNAAAIRRMVRKKLGVSRNSVIIMYAPTWRYGGADQMPEMDYFAVSKEMNERFGGNYYIFNRSHHLTKAADYSGDEHLLDVTDYPDIEELVIASDIMVSDYSSVIWDGALAGLYIILYAPDAERFNKERGLYVSVDRWGFPVAYSISELCQCIKQIDMVKGKKNAVNLLQRMGSYETGKASVICSRWIAEKCGVENGIAERYYLKHTEEKANHHVMDSFQEEKK